MPLPSISAPGVYVTELPGGSRTLTGVSTSVTAFVGRAYRGAVEEPVLITSYSQFQQEFGGLWRDSALGYAVRDFYLNGGGTAVVVRLVKDAAPAELKLGDELTLVTTTPGSWGNSLSVEVKHPSAGEARETTGVGAGGDVSALFDLEISELGDDGLPTLLETFHSLTLADGPRKADTVLAGSRLLRVKQEPPTPPTPPAPPPGGGEPGDPAGPSNEPPAAPEANRPPAGKYTVKTGKAGDDGKDLTPTEYDDGKTFDAGNRGLYALNKADIFNILCLPPSAPGGDVTNALWATAANLCHRRRAFLIVDPPDAQNASGVASWVGTLGITGQHARNAALYFPRITSPDLLRGGAVGTFVACGAVAGIMARTDSSRGVWKAPAGVDTGVVGASGLAETITDRESGELNPKGVNCLRTFPQMGSVLWGARTLRGADVLADEYKYVPVRRLALFLEESLYRGTQWVVFEPNDEALWSQIRTSCGSFMQDLFRQGAFQGRTPGEAYFVACDGETTTQYDIDRGIVNIVVGFAPLKPTEFVVIAIQQKTAAAAV